MLILLRITYHPFQFQLLFRTILVCADTVSEIFKTHARVNSRHFKPGGCLSMQSPKCLRHARHCMAMQPKRVCTDTASKNI